MGDVVIHPNCFQCSNCLEIYQIKEKNDFYDEGGTLIDLCDECTTDLDELDSDE